MARNFVIVVANEGQRIDIPDGCVLENRKHIVRLLSDVIEADDALQV